MALGTFASRRVPRICHIERPCRRLWSCLKSQKSAHRILTHAQPNRVGFVTGRTTACRTAVNHCRGGCRQHEASPRPGYLCGPARYHSSRCTRQVAGFAISRGRQVGVWTRTTARGHYHNATDSEKAAVRDIGTMATCATRGYAAVVHSRVAETRAVLNRQLQATSGSDMAVFATHGSGWQMVNRWPHEGWAH